MSLTALKTETEPAFDVEAIRRDFPILSRQVHGRPLVFLDTAASAQKPEKVIAAMDALMRGSYANVHRGLHTLSEEATAAYEGAREAVRGFLNASSEREIVFGRSATEMLNLIASSYARKRLQPGDEILLTELEHHANIVPWQMAAEETGARIRVARMDDDGAVRIEAVRAAMTGKTRIVAVTHMSNTMGSVLPVREIAELARAAGAVSVIDGCQGVVHGPVDVQAMGCDFYVFSAHKLYGPTGLGVLWGREALLESMPPYQGGGDMIDRVTFEKTTYAELPAKFEAGTPPIVEAAGLTAAIGYLEGIGWPAIVAHEATLVDHAFDVLGALDGVTLYGTARPKGGVMCFDIDGAHPHDAATILDRYGIAVRAGHHCAQPLMDRLGVAGLNRASFGIYTRREDIDALGEAIEKVKIFFA